MKQTLDRVRLKYAQHKETKTERQKIHRLGRGLRRPDISERLGDCMAWVVHAASKLLKRKGS